MQRGSTMSTSTMQDQKAVARETFVQNNLHADAVVPARPGEGYRISTIKRGRDSALESAAENGFYEPANSVLPLAQVDATKLIRVLRQLEVMARR
jgi:hypothetical protein